MTSLFKIGSVVMLVAAFGANAADQGQGVVNFKGTVVDSPCGITSDTADQSIDFGQISRSQLAGGGISNQKTLDIKLTQCDVSNLNKGVQVTFSGNTISSVNGDGASVPVASELATSGPTNTAVVINNGSDINFGTASDFINLSEGDNTLQFQTWVKQATGKTVAAGDFTAVANFSLSYE